MTPERIKNLADYFYSSSPSGDSISPSKNVPFRIETSYGMGGYELSYGQFIHLMDILANSTDVKNDCIEFVRKMNV